MEPISISVSEFVALLNQTLDYAYPSVIITGELANFRVSKGMWVYFDLKDEGASVKFFGSVRQLPGPLEDGMMLEVRGAPRLHALYGFSVNILSVKPVGLGAIAKAFDLLKAKLAAEGLFDPERKRFLPVAPTRVGLVTSGESAAYADFVKILNARWRGVEVLHVDTQVQGDIAPSQIVGAIRTLNGLSELPEVIVVIRGGGSADDLAAFSDERVVRAVASSRIPTLVAIGHEIDISLAELAADVRASTPSNAAELLVPDRSSELEVLSNVNERLEALLVGTLTHAKTRLNGVIETLNQSVSMRLAIADARVLSATQMLDVLNPLNILERGYAVVRNADGMAIRMAKSVKLGDVLDIQFADGTAQTKVIK